MKIKKYKARVGAKFNNNDAQIIGEELAKLGNKKSLTPDKIVNSAKSKSSPLHKHFEWDDTEAAKEFRLHQARDMVSHIVEIVIIDGEEIDQRSFFSVKNEKGTNEYVTIDVAIRTENYKEQLLTQMIKIMENLLVTMKMFKQAK